MNKAVKQIESGKKVIIVKRLKGEPRKADKDRVDMFNRKYKVGSECIVYKGIKGDGPLYTKTKTEATVLGGHTPVVWVEGEAACIALTHVVMK